MLDEQEAALKIFRLCEVLLAGRPRNIGEWRLSHEESLGWACSGT